MDDETFKVITTCGCTIAGSGRWVPPAYSPGDCYSLNNDWDYIFDECFEEVIEEITEEHIESVDEHGWITLSYDPQCPSCGCTLESFGTLWERLDEDEDDGALSLQNISP